MDQRFLNLGFALARQFCHDVLAAEAPPERYEPLVRAIDKVLDLCVLVETTAYIEAATRCDVEVIRGVVDRLRAPVTVIAGNLQRLHRKGPSRARLPRCTRLSCSRTGGSSAWWLTSKPTPRSSPADAG